MHLWTLNSCPERQSNMKPTFIAEVKTKSPFGYQAAHEWEELFDMANEHGDWISVHTNPLWGGSFELLAQARSKTMKPILAKGIHGDDTDITRAFDAGANYVLVLGRVPTGFANNQDKLLIEPLSFAQYLTWDKLTPDKQLPKVVFNRRNLSTGQLKTEDYTYWRNTTGWLCQASRIRHIEDVKKDADAFIVGTNLPYFIKSLKK